MDQAEHLRNVIKVKNQKQIPDARILTITSGKGGVGKTNIAANLAIQLRKMGKRVMIFDADIGLANVEVMFGSVPRYNLSDVIFRGKKIQDIITWGPMDVGFISGGSGVQELNNLSKEQITFLVNSLSELDKLTDVLIVDTGAGVSDMVMEFVVSSPEVLLVSTPEPASLTDAYSLLKAMHKNPSYDKNRTKIHVIANKVFSEEDGQTVFDKLDSAVTQFLDGDVEFLGMIPMDNELEKAVRQQKIISLTDHHAQSAKAFEILAKNLIYDEKKIPNMKRGISQIFVNFLKRA